MIYDAWIAFLLLVIASVISFAVLVYWCRLSRAQWKRLDYVWLGFTAIGLFGLVEKNQISKSQVEQIYSKVRLEAFIKDIQAALKVSWICSEISQGPFSSNNFEETRLIQDSICAWSERVRKVIEVDINQHSLIPDIQIPSVSNKVQKEFVNDIVMRVEDYNQNLTDFNTLEAIIASNNISSTLERLSPLILILGLAIRISKIEGEIRIENTKRD